MCPAVSRVRAVQAKALSREDLIQIQTGMDRCARRSLSADVLHACVPCTASAACLARMQSAKKSAKASAPKTSLSQAAVTATVDLTAADEAEARRQAEIDLTTELIDRFQHHSHEWEALEVCTLH